RLACARLLLELGLHDRASLVLESCQRENDADPEPWYLFGFCYYRMGGGRAGAGIDPAAADADADAEELTAARERFADVGRRSEKAADAIADSERAAYWADAKECLMRACQLCEASDGDPSVLSHAGDLITEIDAFIASHPEAAAEAVDDDDDGDEEDEDAGDDAMDVE
ncbi:hypothetical protein HK405_014501, partial [Cladochytrium tenue]